MPNTRLRHVSIDDVNRLNYLLGVHKYYGEVVDTKSQQKLNIRFLYPALEKLASMPIHNADSMREFILNDLKFDFLGINEKSSIFCMFRKLKLFINIMCPIIVSPVE